jgi:hypothetical protein
LKSSSTSLPSLTHLDVGFGAGGSLLLHLAQRHAPHLLSLTAHVGAAVADYHLQQLAAACPALMRLRLHGSTVSGEGEAGPEVCHTPLV